MTRRKTIKTRKTKRIRKKAFYGGETVQELRSENTELRAENAELRTEVVQLRTENATLKETVADLIQQVKVLLQTVKDSEERIKNLEERNRVLEERNRALEERNRALEELNAELRKENAELRKENAELKQRVDVLEQRVGTLEQENVELKLKNANLMKDNSILKQNYREERIITALADVISYEKFKKNNPIFLNMHLKKIKESRHRTNHYIMGDEKTDRAMILMREKYLYERLQEMIEKQSPIIDLIDSYIQDMSGNTIYVLMSLLKQHIDASAIVISDSEREFLDKWWKIELDD